MARVVKTDNAILKRIKQKQEREKRKYRTREKRVRVLIVCEGEKTEPNYFGAIDKKLPKGLIELKISGLGDNTINIGYFGQTMPVISVKWCHCKR